MSDIRRFHQDVVTGSGVALGGSVDLEIRDDGSSHVHFHMHGSSVLTSYDFGLRAYLMATNYPTVAMFSSGHTSGVDDWNHDEDSRQPLLASFWPQLVAAGDARLFVQHDWSYSGVIGTVDDVVRDIVDVGAGAVGAALGVVVAATADAISWMGLDLGPGGTIGVIGGVVVFAVSAGLGAGFGGALILAIPAGAVIGAVTEELIDHRDLQPAERELAYSVFGNALDPGSVKLTNLAGLGGRAFTAPGVDGKIYVNLGSAYTDPMSKQGSYPRPGQLLIHELTHAWQIQHDAFLPGLMCSGVVNQADVLLGDSVYDYVGPGRKWGDYNAEQQGAMADQWYGASGHNELYQPMDQQSLLYSHIYADVLGREAPSTARGTLRTSPGSAVGRDPQHLDVFWVQPGGEIGSQWWDAATGNDWTDHPSFTLAESGAGVPGQQVCALARDDTSIVTFWAAADGSLWTASWIAGSTWTKPERIAASGAAMPGSRVAAASRARHQLDVFWIASDGAVWSTWWNDANPSKAWDEGFPFPITDSGAAQPGSGIAAVGRRADHLDVFWVGNDGAIGSQWWDAAPDASWGDHRPFAVTPPGAAALGTAVAVVARTPDHLDIFWIGPDGAVASHWWDAAPTSNWGDHSSFAVTSPEQAQSEAGVSAVARTPDHLDVFWVGPDGAVASHWWDAAAGCDWADHSPFSITPPDAAQLGSPLTAVTRTPAHVDVFWVGPDGAIASQWWDASPRSSWADHSPFPLTGGGVAPVSARAARTSSGIAVSRSSRNVDLVWADAAGTITSNWWSTSADTTWRDHTSFTVSDPGLAQPYGAVASVARTPDHLDVFWIAPDGAVWSTWWHRGNGTSWADHTPFTIASAGAAVPGSTVVAVSRTPGHIDVFWVAPDGGVRSHWWDAAPQCGWGDHQAFDVALAGAAAPGAGLAAIARTPFHLDVFWVTDDGAIGSAWWDGAPGSSWGDHAPIRITAPSAARGTSGVAATARNAYHVDVFWIGPDGAVGSHWWDAAANCNWGDHQPFPITPPNAAAGIGIAAIGRGTRHLDVFWVGPDGGIGSQWWADAPGSNWSDHQAFAVGAPASARTSSPLGLVARTPAHLDVFWITPTGAIGSNWWDAAPGSSWGDHQQFLAAFPVGS